MESFPSQNKTMSKSKSFFRASTRLLVTAALLLGSFFALTKAVLADPAPPGNIDNTATGSFTGETSGITGTVISNTVTLTVREVAGITVQPQSIADAPAGVPNAGPNQGASGINTGDVVYFDFTVTNVGNDPTKFFIPIPDPFKFQAEHYKAMFKLSQLILMARQAHFPRKLLL